MNTEQAGSLHVGFLAADLTHRHGWAHYSLSMVEALRRAGVRVTVIAARNSPPLEGVELLPVLPSLDPLEGGMIAGMLKVLPQVRAALRGCDLIHAAVEPYAPLGALVAASRPFVMTGHGSYVLAPKMRRFPVSRLYAWAYRRARVVCVSRYTAQVLEGALPGVRAAVINNGVDFVRFGAVEHIGGGGVLCVGAVKARKGQLDLVRAMAHMPEVRCIIVGALDNEPSYVEQVRAEIGRLGLSDRVTLAGRTSDADLMRYYAEADVYVLVSRNVGWKFEGYGLSLLEASAAGLPVIGTNGCGAADAVIDGVTGLLVAQEDLEHGLPKAIDRLLHDKALSAQMGAAGREHARGQSWDRAAGQLIALYNQAVRS